MLLGRNLQNFRRSALPPSSGIFLQLSSFWFVACLILGHCTWKTKVDLYRITQYYKLEESPLHRELGEPQIQQKYVYLQNIIILTLIQIKCFILISIFQKLSSSNCHHIQILTTANLLQASAVAVINSSDTWKKSLYLRGPQKQEKGRFSGT